MASSPLPGRPCSTFVYSVDIGRSMTLEWFSALWRCIFNTSHTTIYGRTSLYILQRENVLESRTRHAVTWVGGWLSCKLIGPCAGTQLPWFWFIEIVMKVKWAVHVRSGITLQEKALFGPPPNHGLSSEVQSPANFYNFRVLKLQI